MFLGRGNIIPVSASIVPTLSLPADVPSSLGDQLVALEPEARASNLTFLFSPVYKGLRPTEVACPAAKCLIFQRLSTGRPSTNPESLQSKQRIAAVEKLASPVCRQLPCSEAGDPEAFTVSHCGPSRMSVPLGHEQNVGQSESRMPSSQQTSSHVSQPELPMPKLEPSYPEAMAFDNLQICWVTPD